MTGLRTVDMEVFPSEGWALLSSGDERKIERFGEVVVDRPASQAIWPTSASPDIAVPDAVFHRAADGSGTWSTNRRRPPWKLAQSTVTLELRLTGFGNLGFFPEHTVHWGWLLDALAQAKSPSVLNLFAYTGGASIVCAKAGAAVTHVDAAKSVNSWAQQNAGMSAVVDGAIRYLTDDAMKLVRREIRRGNRYEGVILDPPTFGRGPKGELWKIERDLPRLVSACFEVLSDAPLFILATSHSPGITPAVLRGLFVGRGGEIQSGEMLLTGRGPAIPAGAYLRWTP